MKKLFKIMKSLPYIASAVLLIYVVLCVVDVNTHNMTDLAYSWWNVFMYL